jgi:hypothetical protein
MPWEYDGDQGGTVRAILSHIPAPRPSISMTTRRCETACLWCKPKSSVPFRAWMTASGSPCGIGSRTSAQLSYVLSEGCSSGQRIEHTQAVPADEFAALLYPPGAADDSDLSTRSGRSEAITNDDLSLWEQRIDPCR